MSLKNLHLKLGLALIICGLVIDFAIVTLKESSSRRIASFAEDAPLPPPKLDLWGHSPYGKMNQNLVVQVEAINGIPDHDDQEIKLVAQVTLNKSVDQELSYRWVLPVGASVVSGEIENSWPGIKPGETATAEIYLTGVSREGLAKTVTVQVSGTSTNSGESVKYANSGSFTTDPRAFEELALKKKTEVGKIKE